MCRTVPAAIGFQREQDWGHVRSRCIDLVRVAQQKMHALTGLPPICADPDEWLGQMVALPLPNGVDGATLKTRLYDEYQIEILFKKWKKQSFLRLSVQGYNTMDDLNILFSALDELLPTVQI